MQVENTYMQIKNVTFPGKASVQLLTASFKALLFKSASHFPSSSLIRGKTYNSVRDDGDGGGVKGGQGGEDREKTS